MFSVFVLLRVALASTSADLVAPFEMDEDGKIGYWEFGGSVIVEDDQIRLVPPVQFKRGSAWTNVEIPHGQWTLHVRLGVDEGTGGGGAAIWFIDDYRATGELNGGPRHFTGIAILATVIESGDALEISLIENAGNSITRDTRGVRLPVDGRDFITITAEFVGHKKLIRVTAKSGTNAIKLPEYTFAVDLTDSYIGVTAQSDQLTSRIDLVSVTFDIESGDTAETRDVASAAPSHGGDYVPETHSILRNPIFAATERIFSVMDNGGFAVGTVSTEHVLDVVDELTRVSDSIASFSDLNAFVGGTMMNYTQKWHKRTMRIVEHVRRARNVIGAAWNYTSTVLENFDAMTKKNSGRTMLGVIDMMELFTEETGKMDKETGKALESRGTPLITQVLVGMAAVEMVMVFIFFALLQSKTFREKHLGIASM